MPKRLKTQFKTQFQVSSESECLARGLHLLAQIIAQDILHQNQSEQVSPTPQTSNSPPDGKDEA